MMSREPACCLAADMPTTKRLVKKVRRYTDAPRHRQHGAQAVQSALWGTLSWQEARQGIRAERVANVGCEHDRSQESRVERPR
jgi:hypothetical protein